uniref:Uncharacterized protein n=1 Tax=Octopus bimaculoides TaxID=37653 RepID=A0A0L8G628_OCTBM
MFQIQHLYYLQKIYIGRQLTRSKNRPAIVISKLPWETVFPPTILRLNKDYSSFQVLLE